MNERARRPAMFTRVPAAPIVITAVLGAGVWFLVRALDPGRAPAPEVLVAYAGIVVALGVASTGAWSRWRAHDDERVSEAVSGLVTAWQGLDAQTGISWALWANFREVHGSGRSSRAERRRVEGEMANLLTLGTVERPANHEEHRWWRQNRYERTYAVNRRSVTGRKAERGRDRFEREAVNDPFCWDVETTVFDMRARVFRDARTAVFSLRDAVQTRRLGHGPVRHWVLRVLLAPDGSPDLRDPARRT